MKIFILVILTLGTIENGGKDIQSKTVFVFHSIEEVFRKVEIFKLFKRYSPAEFQRIVLIELDAQNEIMKRIE